MLDTPIRKSIIYHMVKLPTLKCTRCNHEWFPRATRLPKVCPVCKRTDWNKKTVSDFAFGADP
jgi:Zn finger protein HypA/HybF involved in hydrogenase expression